MDIISKQQNKTASSKTCWKNQDKQQTIDDNKLANGIIFLRRKKVLLDLLWRVDDYNFCVPAFKIIDLGF